MRCSGAVPGRHTAVLYINSSVRRSFNVEEIHIGIYLRINKAWICYTKLGCYHIVMVVRVKEVIVTGGIILHV